MDAGQVFPTLLLYALAVGSDFVDGYLARKLGVASSSGALLDAAVDFIFISGVFTYFVVTKIYPVWLLLLIIAMFVQFILTYRLFGIIYDPVGKYYGTVLFCAICLTALFSEPGIHVLILYSLVGVSFVSLLDRILFLFKKTKSWRVEREILR